MLVSVKSTVSCWVASETCGPRASWRLAGWQPMPYGTGRVAGRVRWCLAGAAGARGAVAAGAVPVAGAWAVPATDAREAPAAVCRGAGSGALQAAHAAMTDASKTKEATLFPIPP